MGKVNSGIGLVGVVVVAFANVGTARAQSDELPRGLRESISRTLVDEGFPSAAAAFDTEVKITASDAAASDQFGWSVAISGDTAIVGAPDVFGSAFGSAYVYRRDQGGVDNWGEVTKITPSDAAAGDFFGISVAISGDTAIVGGRSDDNDNGADSGSAYVYRRDEGGVDNWGEVTKITASDGALNDWFGFSVAISGDTAIVGAFGDDDNGSQSGSAYAYRRDEGGVDNWGEVTKITASDGAGSDEFGDFVAISGDTAIVGAHRDPIGAAIGSAYVYFTTGCPPETIGGAIYTECDARLKSGEEGVEVTVSGPNGVFIVMTSGPSGMWHIPDVPCGEYTVTPHQVFREYCHVEPGGDCPPEPCETSMQITVDADHRAENLNIQFLGQPGCEPETIGGAIYADCDTRLTSGEEGVEVAVSGPNGVFSVMTSGRPGLWHIPDVPCGEYTVTPHQVFREYCHVEPGGDCPPEPCETSMQITVDADHRTENLSMQFFGQPTCIINDLNDDGVCTVVFDTELFLQCVYDDDCVGPDGQDLQCAADCNCDGMATIVFDASCFVRDVYVDGVCGECSDAGTANASGRSGGRTASGFTIGGAVYDDAGDPLVSGIEGVGVQVFGAGRKIVATATTAGPAGIWRVDDLAAGRYHVVVDGQDAISILVNEENEASNLSIRFPWSPKMVRTADPTLLAPPELHEEGMTPWVK